MYSTRCSTEILDFLFVISVHWNVLFVIVDTLACCMLLIWSCAHTFTRTRTCTSISVFNSYTVYHRDRGRRVKKKQENLAHPYVFAHPSLILFTRLSFSFVCRIPSYNVLGNELNRLYLYSAILTSVYVDCTEKGTEYVY